MADRILAETLGIDQSDLVKQHLSVLKKTYLFNWNNVPGNDSKRLLRYLMTAHDIGWAENAEIRKSEDGNTIHISKNKNSAEIEISKKKELATLTISSARTLDLIVKRDKDNFCANSDCFIFDALRKDFNRSLNMAVTSLTLIIPKELDNLK